MFKTFHSLGWENPPLYNEWIKTCLTFPWGRNQAVEQQSPCTGPFTLKLQGRFIMRTVCHAFTNLDTHILRYSQSLIKGSSTPGCVLQPSCFSLQIKNCIYTCSGSTVVDGINSHLSEITDECLSHYFSDCSYLHVCL